nr:hypothetical protein CFP56_62128 [Quercus suber]
MLAVVRGRRRMQEFALWPGSPESGRHGGAGRGDDGAVADAAVAFAGRDASAAGAARVECFAVQIAVAELMHPQLASLPAGAAARACFLHHAVDLLERQGFGLGDEEVGEGGAAKTQRAPKEEDLHAESAVAGVDDVGGYDANDAVEKPKEVDVESVSWGERIDRFERGMGEILPITRRRKSDALGADGELEDFAHDDPCRRTPGRGEEENVNAYKDNEGDVCGIRVRFGGTDGSDDELADAHC